jgi:hypothetical protein
MPLKRYHIIVAEAAGHVAFDPGGGKPIEYPPAPTVLDVHVEVETEVKGQGKDDPPVPLALQFQIKAALEAARPVLGY